MSALNLGFFNTSSTRTHVGFQFSTHAQAGGNIAPLSAFEAADLRIYRAADGAAFSATQRSSSNGITITSPFDSLTGFHDVDIDLTDNTDAGFYASGYRYSVVLAPDTETIDSQTITGIVLAVFEIGVPAVNTTQFGGTAGTFASGRPEVNTSHFGGSAGTFASGRPEVNATHFGGTAGTFASGRPETNTTHIAGSAVSTSSAQIGVNVVNAGGTVWGSGAITAGSIAASALNGKGDWLLASTFNTWKSGMTNIANWLGALFGKQTPDATALTEIKATGAGSGTYDATTDSNEAIRDRGDSAWITGTGGDPWSTALPGAYSAGTAGFIVGTNLNATVGSRAATGDAMTLADGAITAAKVATGAIDADAIAADAAQEIADAVLSRNVSNVETTMPEHCLGTVVLASLEGSATITTWIIKGTDGTTTRFTKTITRDDTLNNVASVT